MQIELVVAAARNGVIGNDGAIPWYVPSDLKAFRRLTMGRPIIMGRRTFQSIGRPLDGRTNIVVTRTEGFAPDGVEIARSFYEALEIAAAAPGAADGIMVIGGGEIYEAARPRAAVIHLTRIDAAPDGDTHFPDPEPEIWRETSREVLVPNPRDEFPAVLLRFERKTA
jgi:dihydrofolate reductase